MGHIGGVMGHIGEQYNNILSSIDSPFKKQEERLQKLVKTDYGSAQHVEAFENSFLESLDLTEYFSYPDGSNGTVPDSIIECKEDIQDIAKELAEEIAPLYEAEIVLQEELEAQEVISEHSASPPSSEISSTHQESVLIKPSAFGGLIDIPEAQSEELGSSEANNQMSMAEMMARIQELEEANRAKDATIVKKDEQMQEMVTREEAEKMIAQKDADTISELKANRETINQLQKENAEQDRIIDSKDQKLDTAYMQVEMQKQMLDMKDQQIDGLVRDKDHLEIDKSELKVEVKELKEKLSKGNNDIDNKSYIKGLSEFDAMSDLSDLGKSKSDKGSVGKSSNSSVLRKKLETVEDENKPLKDMLAENFTNNELNSKLVPMIGENSNSNSDNEEKLDSIDFNDIDLT
ncbi:hypothetical protein AWC38_SpisGene24976 [Stylophora pistillata]|uniref:Uncharacterized protein n=1 Tax=Stylophora pistillata TaxID=50429 RepID=A0A2B4R2F9_STYPI|nr:hypothetical protein AWC38_SpisGene24976 [Stylophora pistillata]